MYNPSNSIASDPLRGLMPLHRRDANVLRSAAALKVGSRECVNRPDQRRAAPTSNRGSAISRINPPVPVGAAAPAQNPEPAFSRINPSNPGPPNMKIRPATGTTLYRPAARL